MPPIKRLCFHNPAYTDTTYSSDWQNLSDVSAINLTFLCTSSCDLLFSYAMDIEYNVVLIENYTLVANQPQEFTIHTKTKYFLIELANIVPTAALSMQVFYHS